LQWSQDEGFRAICRAGDEYVSVKDHARLLRIQLDASRSFEALAMRILTILHRKFTWMPNFSWSRFFTGFQRFGPESLTLA
jgi:hypothetical protein